MKKYAVVKTGGKQYLVSEGEQIVVDKVAQEEGKKIDLLTIARFAEDGETLELGSPILKESVQGQVISHLKGDKLRIAKFKAKVRYRRVRGFRPMLSKIKILKI